MNRKYNKIDFIEFSRYIEIILARRNWKFFMEIFPDKNQITQYLNEITYIRNPVAHHRDIDNDTKILCRQYIKRILSFIRKWEQSIEAINKI